MFELVENLPGLQVLSQPFCFLFANELLEALIISFADALDAAEFLQQQFFEFRSDARHFIKQRFGGGRTMPLPVVADGKTMRFVADALD